MHYGGNENNPKLGSLHTVYGFAKGGKDIPYQTARALADIDAEKMKKDYLESKKNIAQTKKKTYNKNKGGAENVYRSETQEVGNTVERDGRRSRKNNAENDDAGTVGNVRTADGGGSSAKQGNAPPPTRVAKSNIAPAPSAPIDTWAAWQAHIAEIKAWAEQRKPERPPETPAQIADKTEIPAKPKRRVKSEPRVIPKEDYSNEYRQNVLANAVREKIFTALQESGHEGWRADYDTLTKKVIRGKTTRQLSNGRNLMSERGKRVLDGLADKDQIRYSADDYNPFTPLGLKTPENGDDLLQFVAEHYMNKTEFAQYKKEYEADYWARKESEAKREAENEAASPEAWRVFSESPENLTTRQREVIEAELETNLRDFIEEQVDDANMKAALFSSPAFKGTQNKADAAPNRNLFGEEYAQRGEQQELGLDGGEAANQKNALPKHHNAERQKAFDREFIETHIGGDLFGMDVGKSSVEAILATQPRLRETYLKEWNAEFNPQKQTPTGKPSGEPDEDLFGQGNAEARTEPEAKPTPKPEPKPKGRKPKGEKIDPDDIDWGSPGRNQNRERVTTVTYKNRKFSARQAKSYTDPYRVYEIKGREEKFLFEALTESDVNAELVKHLGETRGETREIPRHNNKVDDIDLGYEDAMARVQYAGFDHAGHDYSKGKYSETAKSGTDYNKKEYDALTKKIEEAKEEVSKEQIEMYEEGKTREDAVAELHKRIDEGGDKGLVVTNIESGEKAAITKSSVKKIVSQKAVDKSAANGFSAKQHFAAASDIEELFRNSIKVGSHPDKNNSDDIATINRFAAPLYRDNLAYITEKVTRDGERIYSIELIKADGLGSKIEEINSRAASSNAPNPPRFNNKITDSEENVNSKDKKNKQTSTSDASKGDYADGARPDADGETSGLRPVELPELVETVRAILGKSPQIRDTLKDGAKGAAIRKELPNSEWEWTDIHLAADLPTDPAQALKTLAHEIGHIMSKFGGSGKYKAVAQKIKNATETLKQFIEDDPDAVNLTAKDRKRIRREVENILKKGEKYVDEKITKETPYAPEDILAVWNSADRSKISVELEDYIKGLNAAEKKSIVLAAMKGQVPPEVPTRTVEVARPEAIARDYREAILKEADARRLMELKTIYDELYALSKKWHQYDDIEYRQRGEEVFADAISVYLNDPDLLMQEAPNFWRVFHGWEGRRSPFTDVYKEIQELYGRGEEAVQERRLGSIIGGFDKGREQDRTQAQAKDEAKEAEEKRVGNDWWTKTKRAILSRSARMGAIERALRKGGVDIKHDESAVVSLSDRNYAHSAIKEYTATVLNRVGNTLAETNRKGKPVGNGWESKKWGQVTVNGATRNLTPAEALGAFMGVRRMATERSEIANILDKKSAERMLAHIKKTVGDANYEKLEKAAAEYNEIRQELIIPELERSGAFGKELLKKLKENDVYATFKVVFEGDKENFDGAYKIVGIHAQKGSLLDFGNAFVNTVANDVELINFAKQNKHKLNTINILKLDDVKAMGYKIEEAEKAHGVYLNLDAKHRTLQTVHVSENGEHKAYNVDKSMANIMSVPTANNGGLMKGLRVFGQFQKDMFINYAPTFHAKNPFRDTWETLMKNPELLGSFTFYRRLLSSKAFREAWAFHSKGELDGTTSKMLRDGALNAGFYNMRSKNTGIFNSDLEKDFGLMPLPAQERKSKRWLKAAADFTASLASPVTKPIGKHVVKPVSDTWSNLTGSLEYMTKIAAYEGLKKKHPDWSERELAYHVRRFAGTPDIMDGGELTPVMKEIFLFSNPQLQGLYTTLQSFKNHPVATPILVVADMLLKAPMFLAKIGATAGIAKWILDVQGNIFGFGPDAAQEVEDIYNETISYYKKKYYVIPTPWKADDGVPYIITIPRGFFGEFTSTLSYNLLDMITGKKFRSEDYFNAVGDLIPYNPESTQPSIQVLWAYLEWAYGINPEDMYRNRKIIPQKIHGAGKLDEAPYMAGWTVEKMAGSGVTKNIERIKEYATGEKNFDKSLLDNVLEFPVLGRIPSQFIRRADGGVDEKKREAKAEQRRQKKQRNAQKEREKRLDSWR